MTKQLTPVRTNLYRRQKRLIPKMRRLSLKKVFQRMLLREILLRGTLLQRMLQGKPWRILRRRRRTRNLPGKMVPPRRIFPYRKRNWQKSR